MFLPYKANINSGAYPWPTLSVKLLNLKLLDNHTGVMSAETKCIA